MYIELRISQVWVWQFAMNKKQNACRWDPQLWILLRGLYRIVCGSKPVDLPHLTTGRDKGGKRGGSSLWGAQCNGTAQHSAALQACLKATPQGFLQGAGLHSRVCALLQSSAEQQGKQRHQENSSNTSLWAPRNGWPQSSTFGRLPSFQTTIQCRSYLMSWYSQERVQPFPRLPPTTGSMALHLPAAYGREGAGGCGNHAWSDIQICFITQKDACSAPGTRRRSECLKWVKIKYSGESNIIFFLPLPRRYFEWNIL